MTDLAPCQLQYLEEQALPNVRAVGEQAPRGYALGKPDPQVMRGELLLPLTRCKTRESEPGASMDITVELTQIARAWASWS